MTDIRDRAIQLYDAFTHEHRDRRALLGQMAALVGSVAAAEALIATIAASPAAAQVVAGDDKRLLTGIQQIPVGGGKTMAGYCAAPAGAKGKLPGVMVIHENRGLTPHIQDVARRVALAGYFAVAPDFLTPAGGTPTDEDKARDLINALDYPAAVAGGVATLDWLRTRKGGNGKAGAVGFCWGGAMVNRVAVAAGAKLDAGVSYYGPAPDPAEAPKVHAALLLQLAGKDTRVNGTGLPWGEALKAAGKTVIVQVYPDVDHAFNNDSSAARYNAAAAGLAWERTLAFFKAHLDG